MKKESQESITILVDALQGREVPVRVRSVEHPVGRALLCRGLTGSLAHHTQLDDLASSLQNAGWSTLIFDYGLALSIPSAERMPALLTAYNECGDLIGGPPDVVIARGYGARVSLELLQHVPEVPFVWWAPIVWLRTSLELRGRLHELRRLGRVDIEGQPVAREFIEALEDPSDAVIQSWVVPDRYCAIVQGREDNIVPVKLGRN